MNNRQAALIAAASSVNNTAKGGIALTWNQNAKRIVENAALLEEYLNEQDAADSEGREPRTIEVLIQAREDEKAYGIPRRVR